jgi:hypothetical protein
MVVGPKPTSLVYYYYFWWNYSCDIQELVLIVRFTAGTGYGYAIPGS